LIERRHTATHRFLTVNWMLLNDDKSTSGWLEQVTWADLINGTRSQLATAGSALTYLAWMIDIAESRAIVRVRVRRGYAHAGLPSSDRASRVRLSKRVADALAATSAKFRNCLSPSGILRFMEVVESQILAARSFATAFTLDADRLNALDDVWTAYLNEDHDPLELERDYPSLQRLGAEIIDLLASLAEKSPELRQLILEFPSDLDEELDLLVADHPAKEWLLANRPAGHLAENALQACERIQLETPEAILEIAKKLKQLAAKEFTSGDIPQALKCAILMAGIGAGVLAVCAGPGALIALPAAVVAGASIGGSVATGLAAIRGWNCLPPPEARPATS
jgi:hypothetical protein